MSFVSPNLFEIVLSIIDFLLFFDLKLFSVIFVLTYPGQILLNLIFLDLKSTAAHLVNCASAAFDI